MPPAGRPRPDEAAYRDLRTWLESELDRHAAAAPNPGKLPPFQRLTRTEYRNAVRDLLALEQLPKSMDIELLLPADNSTSGFDNIRDLLFVSPTQLEQYLSAARKISRIAVGDPSIPLIVDRYALSAELPQDGQLENAPFGTRGGIVVHTNLPLDGEYSIDIDIPGGGRGHQLEIRIDGERVQFLNLGEGTSPSTQRKPSDPNLDEASKVVTSAGSTGTARFERDRLLAARRAAAGGINLVLPFKAGPHEILATFVRHSSVRGEELVRPPLRGRGGQPGVSTLTIKGPFDPTGSGDTPSRRRVFVCRPAGPSDERRCANRDSVDACAQSVSAALDQGRRAGADALLRERQGRGRVRQGHPAGARTNPREPAVSVPHRSEVRRHATRGLPGERSRARVAPVVLSVEQHSG